MQFKPFTTEEVSKITECPTATLDRWMTKYFTSCRGDDGTFGLDWMQTFAIFVGWRYMKEGSTVDRAVGVMALVASQSLEGLEKNHKVGNTFAVPAETINRDPSRRGKARYMGPGIMVRPPKTPLGQRLCTRRLLEEFKEKLERAFPQVHFSIGGTPNSSQEERTAGERPTIIGGGKPTIVGGTPE